MLLLLSIGIFAPSSGTAEIFGYDITSQLDLIRPSIGFCPQTSILYDELTVYEHLYIIASVKNNTFLIVFTVISLTN